eukprot:TRINITY_DN45995_c0_g1_i1.p1 TRINITY_DN45995_c0_g1~~TRINITY_DN45995_c0_g1_i1.p1  ORF type:complete len:106 (+),score=18.98 TRINITY_DN45995_c0_g1_i1:128-445(+)
MLRSLVGSEMCIRDSFRIRRAVKRVERSKEQFCSHMAVRVWECQKYYPLKKAWEACGWMDDDGKNAVNVDPRTGLPTMECPFGWEWGSMWAVSYTHLTLPTKRIV